LRYPRNPEDSLNFLEGHQKEYRRDRRLKRNQLGKRKVVVIVRDDGNSVPAEFHSESQASAFILTRIAKGTVVHADEAGSWDNLHERFEVKRIKHQETYSLDGACTNWAEEYFSRLRRAEVGVHHHIAGAYLLRYAQESSWREDNRRASNGDQVSRVAALAMKRGKSVDFAGYWQRHIADRTSKSGAACGNTGGGFSWSATPNNGSPRCSAGTYRRRPASGRIAAFPAAGSVRRI
jgi:hypothetical protein